MLFATTVEEVADSLALQSTDELEDVLRPMYRRRSAWAHPASPIHRANAIDKRAIYATRARHPVGRPEGSMTQGLQLVGLRATSLPAGSTATSWPSSHTYFEFP